ncbi:hypothetical protein INT45_010236 [Circinella minor]|uniref:Uncharacterized protein n=1 Tax=Circinella minor TaxID=1195481 RepID=A0A8H7RN36_9FUNG|nr:hypothetical protein INT45_010236 [Circinella minor]
MGGEAYKKSVAKHTKNRKIPQKNTPPTKVSGHSSIAVLQANTKLNTFNNDIVPRKKVRNGNSRVSKAAHKMRTLLENKTDKELKRFPWSEFKLTKSDVYPDKHYYYHSGEKLAIVGFDYGVDHRTGLHYKTAVSPKDLLAEKQQQLEKALDDNTVHLVKEDEILQFLLLCKIPVIP